MALDTIYDWPIPPTDQLFHVPGAARYGGFTLGGALTMQPAVGGRAVLDMAFGKLTQRDDWSEKFSWAASQVSKGTIFRIPIACGRQLVSFADLGLVGLDAGTSWDSEIVWDNGQPWQSDVVVALNTEALEGSTTLVIEFGDLALGLTWGHVIGVGRSAHSVEMIEYNGTIATVQISPPLRADAAAGDLVTFRPTMLATCVNPDSFKALLVKRRWATPGAASFVEAIL